LNGRVPQLCKERKAGPTAWLDVSWGAHVCLVFANVGFGSPRLVPGKLFGIARNVAALCGCGNFVNWQIRIRAPLQPGRHFCTLGADISGRARLGG